MIQPVAGGYPNRCNLRRIGDPGASGELPQDDLFVLLEQLVSKVAALGQHVEDHPKFPVVEGWSDVPQVQQIIVKYEKGSLSVKVVDDRQEQSEDLPNDPSMEFLKLLNRQTY